MARILVSIVLALFTAFSGYVTWQAGYFSVFPPFKDLATTQIFLDLTIALNLVLFLLYRDFKKRKQPTWPVFICGLGVVLFGSLAPLLFLAVYKEVRLTT